MLVWMLVHHRLPAAVIDHKDGNRLNDHPDNLQEHSWAESHRQGNEKQTDANLAKCLAFFEEVGCKPL